MYLNAISHFCVRILLLLSMFKCYFSFLCSNAISPFCVRMLFLFSVFECYFSFLRSNAISPFCVRIILLLSMFECYFSFLRSNAISNLVYCISTVIPNEYSKFYILILILNILQFMARTSVDKPYSTTFNSFITGHHVYKGVWSPVLGE